MLVVTIILSNKLELTLLDDLYNHDNDFKIEDLAL